MDIRSGPETRLQIHCAGKRSASAWLECTLDSGAQTRFLMRTSIAVHHTALNRLINLAERCVHAGSQRGFCFVTWCFAVSTTGRETALHEGAQR